MKIPYSTFILFWTFFTRIAWCLPNQLHDILSTQSHVKRWEAGPQMNGANFPGMHSPLEIRPRCLCLQIHLSSTSMASGILSPQERLAVVYIFRSPNLETSTYGRWCTIKMVHSAMRYPHCHRGSILPHQIPGRLM